MVGLINCVLYFSGAQKKRNWDWKVITFHSYRTTGVVDNQHWVSVSVQSKRGWDLIWIPDKRVRGFANTQYPLLHSLALLPNLKRSGFSPVPPFSLFYLFPFEFFSFFSFLCFPHFSLTLSSLSLIQPSCWKSPCSRQNDFRPTHLHLLYCLLSWDFSWETLRGIQDKRKSDPTNFRSISVPDLPSSSPFNNLFFFLAFMMYINSCKRKKDKL